MALPLEEAVAEALRESSAATALTPNPLTPREREVLRLLAEGRTDRAIAEALFIGRRTAEGHVARICAKLGAPTRTAAVAQAIAAELIAAAPDLESAGIPDENA